MSKRTENKKEVVGEEEEEEKDKKIEETEQDLRGCRFGIGRASIVEKYVYVCMCVYVCVCACACVCVCKWLRTNRYR